MSVVTPVGIDEPLGSELFAGLRVSFDVGDGVVSAWEESVPARRAGAHHERDAVFFEHPHPREVVIRFVPPIEKHELTTQ